MSKGRAVQFHQRSAPTEVEALNKLRSAGISAPNADTIVYPKVLERKFSLAISKGTSATPARQRNVMVWRRFNVHHFVRRFARWALVAGLGHTDALAHLYSRR